MSKTRHDTTPEDASPGTAGSGKVANDHNSPGDQPPTQLHQGRRTPESRDRDAHIGSGNQVQSRRGAPGSGTGGTPGGGARGAG